MFGKISDTKTALRVANHTLHSLDGLIRDYQKGKLTADDLGKIVGKMSKDIIDSRIAIRKVMG